MATVAPGANDGNGLARLMGRMKLALSDMRRRHELRAEFAEVERNGGLDALLADLGLGHFDLDRLIEGYPESDRLLQGMAERLGFDYEHLEDAALKHEMQRTCSLCAEHGRCRRWLKAGQTEGYRAFCPNGEILYAARGHPGI